MALRLTQKDKDKLKRINNSVRAKSNRLRSIGVPFENRLQPLNIKNITSRKQLNDYYDVARQYTRGYGNRYVKVKPRSSDKVYALRLSDVTSARRLAREVTKDRERRFSKYKDRTFLSRNKPTDSSIAQRQLMGDDRYDMFLPVKLKLESFKSEKDFQNRVNTLLKMTTKGYFEQQNRRLKENIKIAIDNSWGKKGTKAKKLIDNMSDDDFIDTYLTEDIFEFGYIYDENQKDRKIEQFEATLIDKGFDDLMEV